MLTYMDSVYTVYEKLCVRRGERERGERERERICVCGGGVMVITSILFPLISGTNCV